ncbi:hypothetical protein KP509_06G056400 [Ceratopteris richardii]|uniref:Pectin acetylesterase n=1 Tax=Ceratopteris richardii TaxID=49495 RepID=A0A8T2UIH3_CERRI|nr:hypothetical protein KP509_06G056400 [Ceratopteris richardii]
MQISLLRHEVTKSRRWCGYGLQVILKASYITICLDGSPPAYSMEMGSGSGKDSWIVHLQGGGWCNTLDDCLQRSTTYLGSSKYMTAFGFGGILSNSMAYNPDFYNWNRVYVRYCDGGAFSGDVETGVQVTNGGKTSTLYFRGRMVWEAIIDDLLSKGMSSADRAILSGDSAGGSSVIFHCNRFRKKMPSSTDVRCLSDAGYFMDIPNLANGYSFQQFFDDIVALHKITMLPSGCTSQRSLGQCYFPEYSLQYVTPPIFLLQSPYDNFQVRYILAPTGTYSGGSWDACKQALLGCSSSQLSIIQGQLRARMLDSLNSFIGNKNWGMYMISCYYHTQVVDTFIWNSNSKINSLTPAQAFSRWYFQRELVQEVDCPFPCNPTCISTS